MLVTSGTVHVINFVLRTSENGEDVSNFSNSKYEICTLLKKISSNFGTKIQVCVIKSSWQNWQTNCTRSAETMYLRLSNSKLLE